MNLNQVIESNNADRFTFGQYVRDRRESLNKSVRGFSSELGITAAYLSDIEKGNRYAPKNKLELLCKLLQVPEDEREAFLDLASMTRGEYEDINPYLCTQHLARVALRKAKEQNLSEERWREIIKLMDEK